MTAAAIPAVPRELTDLDATFLPLGPMRQIARITHLAGAGIEGEVDLGPTHWVFPFHFPNDPIFPGTLIIEAAGQLVALWAWANGRRGRPRLVRAGAEFHRPTGPAVSHLVLRAEVRRKQHLHFATIAVLSDGEQVATIEAVLAVLPEA